MDGIDPYTAIPGEAQSAINIRATTGWFHTEAFVPL